MPWQIRTFCSLLLVAFLSIWPANNGKRHYLSLSSLIQKSGRLRLRLDPLGLIARVSNNKGTTVTFKIGDNFYITNGNHVTFHRPILIAKGNIMVPKAMAEELLSEFHLPLQYTIGSAKPLIQNKSREKYIRRRRKSRRQVASLSSKNNRSQENVNAGKRSNKNKKLNFIVIDPGHGGKDPGAHGHSNAIEKQITLKVARTVYYKLKKSLPNIKVYITRFGNKFISLDRRSEIANNKLRRNSFGIFISLHCNATLSRRTHGYEIYYLAQNASNEESRQVMLRENNVSGNQYVARLESFLMHSQIQSESKMLARAINRSFLTKLRPLVTGRGVRRADFAVLRGALMPAVLIEMGYLTNRREASMLKSRRYRARIASALVHAVQRFQMKRPSI